MASGLFGTFHVFLPIDHSAMVTPSEVDAVRRCEMRSREEWDNLLHSWHRNLHGSVVVIDGLRVAGLGGVFRGEVWRPPEAAHHPSFASLEQSEKYQAHTKAYRNARTLKHSSTIFPDDYEQLTRQRAL